MGKWLYLAITLQRISIIMIIVGGILIFCPTLIYFYKRDFIEESIGDRLTESRKIKRKAIIGGVILSIGILIPSKEETIQIMLLEQVNVENYNLIKDELGKGTEKIIETIEKVKGE